MKRLFLTAVFLTLVLGAFTLGVRADELEEVTRQLEALKENLKSKEADFEGLNNKLEGIKARVVIVEQAIIQKEREVEEGEEALIKQRGVLYERAFEYYKNMGTGGSSFINILVADNLSAALRNFFYQKTLVDKDKDDIVKIVLFIKDLEEKKAELETEKEQLAYLNEEIARQSEILSGEIAGTQQKVAQLTARQQELIAAKLASIYVPRSADTSVSGCSSDLTNGKDPGFSPRFGFFSYGAPHGNGMNQYGAFGRAKAGQNEEQILQFYYPSMSLKKDYDQNAQVNVEGHGAFSIEDYVKRIYEVPNSWGDQGGMATLKAQAVAARTYALNSMQRNGSICTTESCQVFRPDPKGGNWDAAVEATKGWVLMDGGNPGFTQYASTHGGYVRNLNKFDGEGGAGGFADVNSRAYDRESPWFYCNWGARGEYANTAWLKSWEVADIANVILLAKRDSAASPHLAQTDKGIPNTWDFEKVKSELKSRGKTPFNTVTSVSVGADFGSGTTNSVTVSGDAGAETFSGQEWKDWFNLRAPANIQIKSRLYNTEIR